MAISLQHNLNCCGISEIQGLNTYTDPEVALKTLCRTHWNQYDKRLNGFGAFVVFSAVDRMPQHNENYSKWVFTSGELFADYLKTHHLGLVKDCGRRVNTNSDNTIHVWVWSPRMTALNLWWTRTKQREKEKNV